MNPRTLFLALGLVACAVFFYTQTALAHGPTVVYRGSNVTVRVGPSYHYAPDFRYQRPPVVVVRPPKRIVVPPSPIIYYAPTPHYYRVAPYPW